MDSSIILVRITYVEKNRSLIEAGNGFRALSSIEVSAHEVQRRYIH